MSIMEVCVSVNGLIFWLSEAHCVGTASRAVVGLVGVLVGEVLRKTNLSNGVSL